MENTNEQFVAARRETETHPPAKAGLIDFARWSSEIDAFATEIADELAQIALSFDPVPMWTATEKSVPPSPPDQTLQRQPVSAPPDESGGEASDRLQSLKTRLANLNQGNPSRDDRQSDAGECDQNE